MSSRKLSPLAVFRSFAWSVWHALLSLFESSRKRYATRRRAARVLVLISVAALWSVAAVDLDDLLSWDGFLALLSQPTGVTLGAGAFLSLLVEYWPQYDTLKPKIKRLVFIGFCVAVPVLAATLGVLTVGWSPGWSETFWPAIVTGLFVFGSGTVAHTPRLPDAPDREQVVAVRRLELSGAEEPEDLARMLAGAFGDLGVQVDLDQLEEFLASDVRPDAE